MNNRHTRVSSNLSRIAGIVPEQPSAARRQPLIPLQHQHLMRRPLVVADTMLAEHGAERPRMLDESEARRIWRSSAGHVIEKGEHHAYQQRLVAPTAGAGASTGAAMGISP